MVPSALPPDWLWGVFTGDLALKLFQWKTQTGLKYTLLISMKVH